MYRCFMISSKSTMLSFINWVIHTFSTLQKSLKHPNIQFILPCHQTVHLSVSPSVCPNLYRLLLKKLLVWFPPGFMVEWLSCGLWIKKDCGIFKKYNVQYISWVILTFSTLQKIHIHPYFASYISNKTVQTLLTTTA